MYEGVVQNLIDELGRLPGVGPKGAQRIAFYLLGADPADVRRLAAVLVEVTERAIASDLVLRWPKRVRSVNQWADATDVLDRPSLLPQLRSVFPCFNGHLNGLIRNEILLAKFGTQTDSVEIAGAVSQVDL